MIKLTIELVPKTSWYSNVRSNVSKEEWDVIRREVYAKAGYVCEVCGGVGTRHPVECHEIWEYDDEARIQKLAGMIALCPACHNVKHIGRARKVGIYYIAVNHLMKINEWSLEEAKKYINEAFDEWKERSRHKWKLDLRELNNYNMVKTGDETW